MILFNKILTQNLSHADAKIGKARSLEGLGKKDESEKELPSAFKILGQQITKNPKNDRQFYSRATAYRFKKQFKKVESDLLKAIQLNPSRTNYQVDLKAVRLAMKFK